MVTLEDSDLPIHFKDLSIFSDRPNNFEKVYQINIEKGERIHAYTYIYMCACMRANQPNQQERTQRFTHACKHSTYRYDITYDLYVTHRRCY